MTKILIGVLHTQTVYAEFMISLVGLQKPAETYIRFIGSKTLVDAGRNEVAREAIDGGFTHVFYMDSDQTFMQDALLRLLRNDKDIITGIYTQRDFFVKPTIYRKGWSTEKKKEEYKQIIEWDDNGEPFEVDACGAGCLLIKTEVLKKIGEPYFQVVKGGQLGEDAWFCQQAQKAGYKVWADPTVKCGHLDTIEFTVEQFFAQRDRKKIFLNANPKENLKVKCVNCGKEFNDTMEGEVLYEWLYGDRSKLNVITDCPHCKKPMRYEG